MWYTQGRGQVGSVLGALASGDGIGILFDSLAEDVQVSPGPLSALLPTPSPSSLCPWLRLLVTFHRIAPPSVCWPVMGTPSMSHLGKVLSKLAPTPLLGREGLSSYPHCLLCPCPSLWRGAHPSEGRVLPNGLSSELMVLPWDSLPLGPSCFFSGAWDQLLALPGNHPTEPSIHSTQQPQASGGER